DPRLSAAAQAHAEDMMVHSYYNHASPEGKTPLDRVRKTGYAPHIVAENIARGPFTVDEVMDDWMLSREHRANLLHPAFRDFGAGAQAGNAGLRGAGGKREDEGEGQQGKTKSGHSFSWSACALRFRSREAAPPEKYTNFRISMGPFFLRSGRIAGDGRAGVASR